MTIERDDIVDGLRAAVTRGVKFTALADAIGARKGDYAHMRALLGRLVDDGVVRTVPGGGFALAPHGRPADKKAAPALPWKAEPAAAPTVPATPVPPPRSRARATRPSSSSDRPAAARGRAGARRARRVVSGAR
jgi:uncharacterized membrane protein